MGNKGRNTRKNQGKQGNEKEQEDDRPSNNTASASNILDPNDFISRLPNNILYNIVSLLPFESAVATAVLSTQWKDVWKDVLLDSFCASTMEEAIATVLSFLDDITKQKQPRKKWGFKFDQLGQGRVLLAAFAPNNSLRLDFFAGKEEELPRPFDCLLNLKLKIESSCSHPASRYSFNTILELYSPMFSQQSPFNTVKVISLYLISVSYSSKEAVSSMVSNFPFLQSLTIAKCIGLRSLKVKSARGLCKLVVLDCPQLESLSCDGCSLTSFRYRGRLVCFEFEDQSSKPLNRGFLLNDAMLDLREGPSIDHSFHCDGFKPSILESIRSVKHLTLCRWLFEGLIYGMLPSLNRDSKFRFDALNELWWIDSSMQEDNINVLLNFLELCPYLERLYVTIDPKSYSMTSQKGFSNKVNKLGNFYHLKLLTIEGFEDENQEIFFAKQFRPAFTSLRPLIVAKCKGACLRGLVKARELLKEGKYPYKFEDFKNQHERFPNHIHMKL